MFFFSRVKRRDIIRFFLMYRRAGSKKILCGCASTCGCFAASDLFHNPAAKLGENHHIALCISSKSTADRFMLCLEELYEKILTSDVDVAKQKGRES